MHSQRPPGSPWSRRFLAGRPSPNRQQPARASAENVGRAAIGLGCERPLTKIGTALENELLIHIESRDQIRARARCGLSLVRYARAVSAP